MKDLRQQLMEAGAATETIGAQEAPDLPGQEEVVFVDLRQGHERAQGYIPGSIHAPRGFLEFIAHFDGPMHNPALASGKRLVLYCGSGTRSALAGKTLRDMGLGGLANLAGGIQGRRRLGARRVTAAGRHGPMSGRDLSIRRLSSQRLPGRAQVA
jgi:rhodanese-related sulfurtransferase